jgi:formyltetrahydrofolate synthetase
VVCINAFPDDTQAEYDKLKELCLAKGVTAIVSTAFVDGGKGSAELAEKVVAEINKGKRIINLCIKVRIVLSIKLIRLPKKFMVPIRWSFLQNQKHN